jgi:hypothetical protein
MGCTQSAEMPLQLAAIKRSQALNLTRSESSFQIETISSANLDLKKSFKPQQKLAIRTLFRYANLIVFRTYYISFKKWKKNNRGKSVQLSNTVNTLNLTEDSIGFYCQNTENKIEEREIEKHFEGNIRIAEYFIENKQIIYPSKLEEEKKVEESLKNSNTGSVIYKEDIGITNMNGKIGLLLRFNNEINKEKVAGFIQEYNSRIMMKRSDSLLSISVAEVNCFPINKVFKLFEDIMDSKYVLDKKEMSEGVKPRTLAEFLFDYVNRSFGIKKVAKKSLEKLIKSLQAYQSHNYLSIFCRMLGIYTSAPIPIQLFVSLSRFRSDLTTLISKSPNSPSKARKNDSKSEGGYIPLCNLLDYITKTFSNFFVFAELCHNLCGLDKTALEFILFYSGYRMAKLGLFALITQNNLTKLEYLRLIVQNFNYPLNESECQELKNFVEKETVRRILHEFSAEAYRKRVKSEEYMVSKCSFLLAVINTYEIAKNELIRNVSEMIGNREEISEDEFKEVIGIVEPRFSSEMTGKMWEEVEKNEETRMAKSQSLIYLMVYYSAGVLSDFRKRDLGCDQFNQACNERRIDYADLCLTENDAFNLRSTYTQARSSIYE